ncbi:MAG: hypothetical protein LKE52_05105 [Bacilli bacterium]|jgi:predicted PurR-regulated permease PerM|nr:hypothetical protein [Bacilli bacterium]
MNALQAGIVFGIIGLVVGAVIAALVVVYINKNKQVKAEKTADKIVSEANTKAEKIIANAKVRGQERCR